MNAGPVSITALSSLSALGSSPEEIWDRYQQEAHAFVQIGSGKQKVWASTLLPRHKMEVETLRKSDAKYRALDDSVLFAIYTARKAIARAKWADKANFGINIGSSRGATSLFEKYHEEFLRKGKVPTLSSPTTTLGNISSWVSHDLRAKGPVISHSITCSTALHALLNGVAWIQSGMTGAFLVGGSEAPLTPFTLAQMQALKIYSREKDDFPCRALDIQKEQNTMVLGEGAAMACIEKGKSSNALALVQGMGYATEPLAHNVSISADAKCFQESMAMALGNTPPQEIDAIVLHAPGTIKGDLSEFRAIEKIFCNKIPFLTTNKWKVGHTFAPSGMLGIEMAVLMLQHQKYVQVPFLEHSSKIKSIDKVLVNAVGFGGNAVSVLLSK